MSAYGRPTEGYNDDGLFRLMHKAGFREMLWGIESGSQRVLDLMDKGTKISTIGQVLEKSSKHNIANLCFIIFGFPGETKKEAEKTIAFLTEHADHIDDLLWNFFFWIPARLSVKTLVSGVLK